MSANPTIAALYTGRRFKLADGGIWLATGFTFSDNGQDDAVALESVTTGKQVAMPLQNFKAILASGECGMLDGFNLSDLGNGRRLVYRHGADLHYCYLWKHWLVWDGKRWANDNTGEVQRKAKDTVASIYIEAGQSDLDNRKAIGRWALQSEHEQRRQAMIKSAESEIGIPVLPDDLDTNPWLLNVTNGTLDLRTGELQPHARVDYITKLAPVVYDPLATAPMWQTFLWRIMGEDNELIRFLQRAVGYSLTGNTSEQCLFVLFGTGANGKSTFLQTISALLGPDYARQTPTTMLMQKRFDAIPNDLAALRGARLVTAVETEEGRRLAESLVKQMTGGDKIAARFLHAEWFDFTPAFKIFLGANHKPVIYGTDDAIWRRIHLVPFEVKIPEDERDLDLPEKLKTELPGILNWALQGCQDWQTRHLDPPEKVKKATEDYRNESDDLGTFIACCCKEDADLKTRVSALYDEYMQWCQEENQKAMSLKRFGTRLGERYTKEVDRYVFYRGIGLPGKG